jgi:hypothetical protein
MVMHATHYSYQFACYIIKFDLIPESPHLADHQQHGPPSSVPDTMYKNHVEKKVAWIGRFERLLRSDMATHRKPHTTVSLMGPCSASSKMLQNNLIFHAPFLFHTPHLWHRTSHKLALSNSAQRKYSTVHTSSTHSSSLSIFSWPPVSFLPSHHCQQLQVRKPKRNQPTIELPS